jgi:hypothetical protein
MFLVASNLLNLYGFMPHKASPFYMCADFLNMLKLHSYRFSYPQENILSGITVIGES